MKRRFFRFLKNIKGTTAIEYVLIASLIVLVIVASLRKIGNGYVDIYNNIGDSIRDGEVHGQGAK